MFFGWMAIPKLSAFVLDLRIDAPGEWQRWGSPLDATYANPWSAFGAAFRVAFGGERFSKRLRRSARVPLIYLFLFIAGTFSAFVPPAADSLAQAGYISESSADLIYLLWSGSDR